jgi:hypothetical protein
MTYKIETEDKNEMLRMLNADDLYNAIWEIQQAIRDHEKYSKDINETLESIKTLCYNIDMDLFA